MCLILFSYRKHPRYPLILAANRDEFYDRPTHPLEFWEDKPHILAGRDNLSGGTWLGLSRQGRFAGVTNFRSPAELKSDAPSRGLLVSGFLDSGLPPKEYLTSIQGQGDHYNGFNLLAGDGSGLWYYSNMGQTVLELKPGVYGLSNAFLNTPWPKVDKGLRVFKDCIDNDKDIVINDLFHLLSDSLLPPDEVLPDTGVGLAWERLLAPLFIKSKTYGTRSSAVIVIDSSGHMTFSERTYTQAHRHGCDDFTRTFSIRACDK